jgi:hypothetical protein
VCDEIERKLASGGPAWLAATVGEGRFQEARRLLQAGVGIAVTPVNEDEREIVVRHVHTRSISDH